MVRLALDHAAECHEPVEPDPASQYQPDRLRQLERPRHVQHLMRRSGLTQDALGPPCHPVHHVAVIRSAHDQKMRGRAGHCVRGRQRRVQRTHSCGAPSIGRWSTIFSPYPSSPTTVRRVFESRTMLRMPRSTRICAPIP